MQHHLLWVWADASPNAQLECLSKQPAIVEELLQDDQVLYVHPWYATATLSSLFNDVGMRSYDIMSVMAVGHQSALGLGMPKPEAERFCSCMQTADSHE